MDKKTVSDWVEEREPRRVVLIFRACVAGCPEEFEKLYKRGSEQKGIDALEFDDAAAFVEAAEQANSPSPWKAISIAFDKFMSRFVPKGAYQKILREKYKMKHPVVGEIEPSDPNALRAMSWGAIYHACRK